MFIWFSIPKNTRLHRATQVEQPMSGVKCVLTPLDDTLQSFTSEMCCSIRTLFWVKRHQRRLGNRTLETNPHTLAFYLHGGWYGYLHAWKSGFTSSCVDYGRFSCPDIYYGYLHSREDLYQCSTLSPKNGSKQAACGHNQYQFWKRIFRTSHAGKEMSKTNAHVDTIRRGMGAPEFFQTLILI
jgi:hypothetical protein